MTVRCRGILFRDEDDAFEHFEQEERDDPRISAVLLPADAGELAKAATRVHVEAAGENDDQGG